jgi:hypothetical protein
VPNAIPNVYRGGPDLKPTPRDVKVDPATGLILPIRGISVHADPAKVRRFGGAYRIESSPPGLKIEQRGRDPGHYEVIPTREMSMQEYEALLGQVVQRSE